MSDFREGCAIFGECAIIRDSTVCFFAHIDEITCYLFSVKICLKTRIMAMLCFQAVTELISRGADVTQRSKDGMTPLSIAAFWGYADIARSLVKSGYVLPYFFPLVFRKICFTWLKCQYQLALIVKG